MGAKFIETGVSAEGHGRLRARLTDGGKGRQQEVLEARIAPADAVITTASIPGRRRRRSSRAPRSSMRPAR